MKFFKPLFIFLIASETFFAQQWTSWGDWNSINCFKGIEFRIRSRFFSETGKYEGYVEFKNNYDKDIYFNYQATGGDVMVPPKRVFVQAGKTTESWMGKDFTDGYFYIFINRLRYGKDEGNFAGCDEKKE